MTALTFHVTTKLPLASATTFSLVSVTLNSTLPEAGMNSLLAGVPSAVNSCAAAFTPSCQATTVSPLASPAIDKPAGTEELDTVNGRPFRVIGSATGETPLQTGRETCSNRFAPQNPHKHERPEALNP